MALVLMVIRFMNNGNQINIKSIDDLRHLYYFPEVCAILEETMYNIKVSLTFCSFYSNT